jgi:hypothetical protein
MCFGKRGPVGDWQRYEEATMCQRRPADPTDPGDAADLRHGVFLRLTGNLPRAGHLLSTITLAQELMKINSFLTKARESLGLR